jgi:hypothetical protein
VTAEGVDALGRLVPMAEQRQAELTAPLGPPVLPS